VQQVKNDLLSQIDNLKAEVERPKIGQTATRDMMGNLHLFVDPSKVPGVVKELFAGVIEKAKKKFGTETPKEATDRATAYEIWKDTGFYLNPYDNKWRYELDDSTAVIKKGPIISTKYNWTTPITDWSTAGEPLSNILEHPNLYKVYPELQQMKVFYEGNYRGTASGWFDDLNNTIHITPKSINIKESILHEVQHHIQKKEGFAYGSAVNTSIDKAGASQAFALSQKVKSTLEQAVRSNNDIALDFARKRDALLRAAKEHGSEIQELVSKVDEADTAFRKASDRFTYQDSTGSIFIDTPLGKQLSRQIDRLVNEAADVLRMNQDDAYEIVTEIRGTPNHDIMSAVSEQIRLMTDHERSAAYDKAIIKSIDNANSLPDLKRVLQTVTGADYEAYKAVAGEIEARDVEIRSELGPEVKKEILPLSSEQWKAEDVIVHYEGGGGQQLYSGIPVDKAIAAGRKFADSMRKDREAGKLTFKEWSADFRDTLNKRWIGQSANIRRRMEQYGDRAKPLIEAMALAKGGHPHAANMRNQAAKEIYSGLSLDERKILDDLVMADRIVAISKTESGKRFQYPEGKSPAESALFSEGLPNAKVNGIKDLTPEREAEIRKRAKAYSDWQHKPVDDAFAGQLIGYQEMHDLKAQNYRRISLKDRSLARIVDKKREAIIGGRKRTIYDSGIETLASGKKTDILEPNSELMMLEFFNRIYNRIHSNLANLQLLDLARVDKQNPFARVKEYTAEVLTEQPKDRDGLIRSIGIKQREQGISDYEMIGKRKDLFKKSNVKKLSTEQLAQLDKALGAESKGYVKGSAEKIPSGWVPTFLYEKGSRKTIWMEPEFAKEWLTTNSQMTGALSRFARVASGASLVRMFATGINPIFALRNLPRDAMQSLFAARTFENGKWKSLYSSFLPKGAVELGKDYLDVIGDSFLRKGDYNDYIADGGGMDFLVLQGRPFRKGLRLEGPVDRVYDFLGYLNETSEVATRLAIRRRVIKNEANARGISIDEAKALKDVRRSASFAALDYMNFGEGGGFSKAIDHVWPYFNARIVGTRSLFRTFKPGSGTGASAALKMVQFAGIVTGLYWLSKTKFPRTMAALEGDRRTEGNLIIPLSNEPFKDKDGQDRFPFLAIPIDQGQKFFKTLFEAFTDKWLGNKVNATRVVQALKDSSPADVTTLPPWAAAVIGYATNTNFWLSEDVWRATERPFAYQFPKWATGKQIGGSEEEYIPGKTPTALTHAGKITGASPERLKYALGQLLTNDNFYGGILGWGYDKLMSDLPKDQREQVMAEALSKVPGIKTFFKTTSPSGSYRAEIDEGREEAAKENFYENRGLDLRANQLLYQKNIKYKEVTDYIDRDPETKKLRTKDVVDRLKDRLDFHEKTVDLPSRGFWLGLRGITDTKGRAKTYVEILSNVNDLERSRILGEEKNVLAIEARNPSNFNIFTSEFKQEVMNIQRKEVKYPGLR